MHLCTKVTAISWMLEPFVEVGGDVPEQIGRMSLAMSWRSG